jgi:hypothetical protein
LNKISKNNLNFQTIQVVFGYWPNQVTKVIFFSTKPTYKTNSHSNFAFFDQLCSQIGSVLSKQSKNLLYSVANCLKISNLFSEVRLHDAELTSILRREKWREKFQRFVALARVPK